MPTSLELQRLFDEAIADVSSGRAKQRNCGTSRDCRIMTGCVACSGVLRGEVGVERVDVYPTDDGFGVIRITTTGEHKSSMPCTVSFKVPMTVHGRAK